MRHIGILASDANKEKKLNVCSIKKETRMLFLTKGMVMCIENAKVIYF